MQNHVEEAEPSQAAGAAPLGAAAVAAASANFSCAVCRGLLVAPHSLACAHMFCGPCLAKWLDNKRQCPTCRCAVEGESMSYQPVLPAHLQLQGLEHTFWKII